MVWRCQLTHITDLASVSYMGLKGPIRAIGWLESPHAFPQSSIDPEFGEQLMLLVERPARCFFALGMHWCSLCAAEGKLGPDGRSSQWILLVPAPDCVYETPIWIGHYVLRHAYLPPDEFCRAVQSCPEPGSDEFRRALIAHIPGLSRLEESDHAFFAKFDAQQTLQSCPEHGSEERSRATCQEASKHLPTYFRDL